MTQHITHFSEADRDTQYGVLYAWRGMRHFPPNTRIDEQLPQRLLLAARAENLGMGWVSLFDPRRLEELQLCPAGAKLIALLCLGPVQEFYARPMLEKLGRRQGKSLSSVLMEDGGQGGNL